MTTNTELTETQLKGIKRKIVKLKNLYEGAKAINSDAEAEAAAAALQRLLTQYNIEVSSVEFDNDDENKIIEQMGNSFTFKSIGGDWEYLLMRTIARNNFCQIMTFQKSKDYVLCGKKENIEMCTYLFNMLSHRYVKSGKEHFKEFKRSNDEMGYKICSMDTYLRKYLKGCSDGLSVKFFEEKERQEQERGREFADKVTSLVVRNDAEVTEYLSEKYRPKNVRYKSTTQIGYGYNKGYVDGKNTSIYKPLAHRAEQAGKVRFLK